MGAAKKELVYHVTVEDENNAPHTFGPGDDVPAWAAKKITNPKAWGKATAEVEETESDESDEDDEFEDDYDSWKVPQLKDEIDARNEGRDEDGKLSKEGNKPDLIATLRADDAEADAAGE